VDAGLIQPDHPSPRCLCSALVPPAQVSGTIPYTAPELCDMSRHEGFCVDYSTDVWAFGVLLFCMLTGNFPWEKALPSDSFYQEFVRWQHRRRISAIALSLASSSSAAAAAAAVPSQWRRFTEQALRMFRRLLAVEHERRCSVKEVFAYFSHSWMLDGGGGGIGGGDNNNNNHHNVNVNNSSTTTTTTSSRSHSRGGHVHGNAHGNGHGNNVVVVVAPPPTTTGKGGGGRGGSGERERDRERERGGALSSSSSSGGEEEEEVLVERMRQQTLSPLSPLSPTVTVERGGGGGGNGVPKGVVMEPGGGGGGVVGHHHFVSVSTNSSVSSTNSYDRVPRENSSPGGRMLVTTPIEICV